MIISRKSEPLSAAGCGGFLTGLGRGRRTLRLRVIAILACAGAMGWGAEHTVKVTGARMEGGSSAPGGLFYSWGDRTRVHDLGKRSSQVLGAETGFGRGGCVVDVNQDGQPDLVLQHRGEMVWLEAPHFRRHLIDTEADFRDCAGARILGRWGVLVTHRQMQIRFYEGPLWRYREMYSMYTASAQGGLALADVNGDGLTDILTGNYWLQSP